MVFDKTGTLTRGHLTVMETLPAKSMRGDQATLLRLAASVEQYSDHPLALCNCTGRHRAIAAGQ